MLTRKHDVESSGVKDAATSIKPASFTVIAGHGAQSVPAILTEHTPFE